MRYIITTALQCAACVALLTACSKASTQALIACKQYSSSWVNMNADPGDTYVNFQTIMSNFSGDMLAGVQDWNTYGSPWTILKLPMAQDALTPSASPWTIVDQVPAPTGTQINVVIQNSTLDTRGNLYFQGTVYSSGTWQQWWVRSSSNAGASFTQSDTYSGADLSGGTNAWGRGGVFSDTAGNIYALGAAWTSSNEVGVIRRSSNSGATWTTVVHTQLVPFWDNVFTGMTQLANGNLIATAIGYGSDGFEHGLVYRSTNGGTSFSLLSNYFPTTGANTAFESATVDATGNLWITSIQSSTTSTDAYWQTLKSADGGNTFTVSDNYVLTTGQGASDVYPIGIMQDTVGNLYVRGYATDSGGKGHGIVRMTSNGGGSWSTFYDTGPGTYLYGMGSDAFGDLFVAGQSTANGTVARLNCED